MRDRDDYPSPLGVGIKQIKNKSKREGIIPLNPFYYFWAMPAITQAIINSP
jgi:hypothetical protein